MTDRRTDGWTLHDSKDRAYASHRAVKMKKLHWTDSEFDRTYFLLINKYNINITITIRLALYVL